MAPPTERRFSIDRRDSDVGPPVGRAERRRRPDRRLPLVTEEQFSYAEWNALFGVMAKKFRGGNHMDDHTADVLGRAR